MALQTGNFSRKAFKNDLPCNSLAFSQAQFTDSHLIKLRTIQTKNIQTNSYFYNEPSPETQNPNSSSQTAKDNRHSLTYQTSNNRLKYLSHRKQQHENLKKGIVKNSSYKKCHNKTLSLLDSRNVKKLNIGNNTDATSVDRKKARRKFVPCLLAKENIKLRASENSERNIFLPKNTLKIKSNRTKLSNQHFDQAFKPQQQNYYLQNQFSDSFIQINTQEVSLERQVQPNHFHEQPLTLNTFQKFNQVKQIRSKLRQQLQFMEAQYSGRYKSNVAQLAHLNKHENPQTLITEQPSFHSVQLLKELESKNQKIMARRQVLIEKDDSRLKKYIFSRNSISALQSNHQQAIHHKSGRKTEYKSAASNASKRFVTISQLTCPNKNDGIPTKYATINPYTRQPYLHVKQDEQQSKARTAEKELGRFNNNIVKNSIDVRSIAQKQTKTYQTYERQPQLIISEFNRAQQQSTFKNKKQKDTFTKNQNSSKDMSMAYKRNVYSSIGFLSKNKNSRFKDIQKKFNFSKKKQNKIEGWQNQQNFIDFSSSICPQQSPNNSNSKNKLQLSTLKNQKN